MHYIYFNDSFLFILLILASFVNHSNGAIYWLYCNLKWRKREKGFFYVFAYNFLKITFYTNLVLIITNTTKKELSNLMQLFSSYVRTYISEIHFYLYWYKIWVNMICGYFRMVISNFRQKTVIYPNIFWLMVWGNYG